MNITADALAELEQNDHDRFNLIFQEVKEKKIRLKFECERKDDADLEFKVVQVG